MAAEYLGATFTYSQTWTGVAASPQSIQLENLAESEGVSGHERG